VSLSLTDGWDDEDIAGVAKKKARSRANSDDEESYARPIHNTSRRSGPSVPLPTDTPPSAFSTLSSIATDALYALEREEALRRAEYEAKHSEILRRVEHAARHAEILQSFGRLSKSAATSPVATPYLPSRSASREYFDPEVDDDSTMRSRRRASGGWVHDLSPHSYGTGYSVDGEPRRCTPGNWTSHSQSTSSHPTMFIPSDDSPSPRSTDEELPTPPAQLSAAARSSGAYMTPSTSPFLGGLSTLNIHSTQPSRAPSPIMLPPPATRPGSPGDDVHRRRNVPDSPPISFSVGRKRRSSSDYEPHSAPAFQPTFPHQRGFPVNVIHPASHTHSALSSPYGFTTPALSSGPSSSGSSPSSHPHSRAPSPPHAHPSYHSQSHHVHSSPYLAHSVRVAFGMTPIHTTAPLPQVHAHVPSGIAGASMPSSRAGSPPIKLAPLRVPSPSALGDERGGKSPKMSGVALPGFSEVEAATRAL
jgi:zinc finger protein CreA/MIG